jgi:hypothetical protein
VYEQRWQGSGAGHSPRYLGVLRLWLFLLVAEDTLNMLMKNTLVFLDYIQT